MNNLRRLLFPRNNTLKQLHASLTTVASKHAHDYSGIFPPLSTPFDNDGDIHWEKFELNLEKLSQIPFRGYVVQGSNGEYTSMSQQEKVATVDFVRKNSDVDKLLLAGSGCEGTRETVELTARMADVGADAALVVTPSFFKTALTTNAFIQHYTQVADKSPIPLILYNVPRNTGVEFPLDAITHLAKHPNIHAIKDSGGNITKITQIIHETESEDFVVLAGSAGFLMPAMQVGAVGGVCALANVLGQECCDLFVAVAKGDVAEARKLQLALVAPNQAITAHYNVPGLKYAMDLAGYYGGPPRLPLTILTEEHHKDIERSFLGFLPE